MLANSFGVSTSADGELLHGCFPLLPQGLHVTSAYNAPLDSHANAAARKAWGEFAASTTIDSWTVAFTWEQLEPFPGEINVSYVADVMRTLHQVGYRSMVGIHVLQGRRLTVPADMVGTGGFGDTDAAPHPEHGQGLRAGLHWGSPELLQRFHAMLKVALPTIAYYGAYHVNVAARLDQRLLCRNATACASSDEFRHFGAFLRHAQGSIRSLTSGAMSMGVTLTQAGLAQAHGSNAPWLRTLHSIVHNTPVEYVPLLGQAAQASPPPSPLFDIPALLGPQLPRRMCLALVQVAHPSAAGAAADDAAAAEEAQAQFMADVLAATRASQTHMPGRLRVLAGGHLVDRPPSSCAEDAQARCWPCAGAQQGTALLAARQHCSGGLLRDDGSPKPAWHAWIDGVRRLRVAAGATQPGTWE